jgi:hypothetical protein
MNMNLTSEEITLIEQKRAEKRLMELELQKSYTTYKENRINAEMKRCKSVEEDAELLKSTYESNFNELIKVSKDFTLESKKVEEVRTINLYDVDENGYEVRSEKPKEVIQISTYHYKLTIKYTGEVAEGHNYYVTMVTQYSKYSGRAKGYKMQVQGTGINSWDRRGQMTNPKTVHQRIVDHAESQLRQIEYRTAQEQSNKRIKDRIEVKFGKFASKIKNNGNNEFVINLDNEIRIVFYGHEDGNGNINFNNPKVTLPYNKVDINTLIETLSTINGGE